MSRLSLQPATAPGLGSESGQVTNTDKFKATDIFRSDTPDTVLSNYIIKPDITLLCDLCSDYVDICHLPYHRMYHEALITLNYSNFPTPKDLNSLLQRRSTILKKLQTENNKQLCCENVRKVDTAYEELKNYVEDISKEFSFIDNKVINGVTGVSLSCSCDCVYAVGICSHENNRWKSCMEDYQVYQDYFGEDRNKSYFAIFDGYHGANAAERSGKQLHHLLLYEMAKFDSKIQSTIARNFAESVTERMQYEELRPETRDSFRVNLHQDSMEIVQNILNLCYEKYDKIMKDKKKDVTEKERKTQARCPMTEQIHNAFKTAYLLTDILLSNGEDERSKVRWSGTSALTVIIQNVKSQVNEDANTLGSLAEGFSESDQRSGETTESGKPAEVTGFIHLANAGNSRALLIQGSKAICLTKDHTAKNPKERKRVLSAGGNFSNSEKGSKVNGVLSVTRGLGNHGDKKLKDCVIVDPYVTTVPIDQHAQLLVLASDGVWQVLSDDEVSHLLVKMLPDQQIPPPSRVSESILSLLQRTHGNTSRVDSRESEPDSTLQQGQEKNERLHQGQICPSEGGHKSGSDWYNDVQQPTVTGQQQPTVTSQQQATVTGQLQPTVTGQLQPTVTGQLQPTVSGQLQPTVTGQLQPTVTGQQQQPTVTGQLQPTVTGQQEPTVTGQPQPIVTGQQEPTVTGQQEPTVTGLQQPTVTSLQQPTVTSQQQQPTVTGQQQATVTGQQQQPTVTGQQLNQECLSLSLNHSDLKELAEVTKDDLTKELMEVTKDDMTKELMEATKDDLRKELVKSMAEQLTQAALMAGAKDNISVTVVLLSSCGIE